MQKNRLICVTGPTASGKTQLSVALAKLLNTEIISADSMQIYCGMDIGTAKPSLQQRQSIQHHMLDIVQPTTPFSVAQYVERADICAQNILSRGKIPIVVGGTALYMDALIECNSFSGEDNNIEIRNELQKAATEHGVQYVHNMLKSVDPESAQRIHPNNLKRVIRALEVYRQTGYTIGKWNEHHKRGSPKYQALILGVCPSSREVLYARIHMRIEEMLQAGLVQEATTLYKAGLLVGTASQAIGYKELIPYLQGHDTLENCVELLKQRTRNYAKRQLTWLKRDDRIRWIYYNENSDFRQVLHTSTEYIQGFGV